MRNSDFFDWKTEYNKFHDCYPNASSQPVIGITGNFGEKGCELAEGYYTVKAIRKLGKAYGVELPICNAVYEVLYEGKEPRTILKKLFERSLKNEFMGRREK